MGVNTSASELQVPLVFVSENVICVAVSVKPSLLLRLRLKVPNPSTCPGTLFLKLGVNPEILVVSVTAPRV